MTAKSKTGTAKGWIAPDFELQDQEGNGVRLSDFRGKPVVIYFYPKDLTPACTTQACDFRDRFERLQARGAVVIGISTDPVKQHARFAQQYELPFLLLADEEHQAAEKYGVWNLKKLYGREYMGIVRSTFLLDGKGIVRKEWRNVRVKGHVDEVAAALELL